MALTGIGVSMSSISRWTAWDTWELGYGKCDHGLFFICPPYDIGSQSGLYEQTYREGEKWTRANVRRGQEMLRWIGILLGGGCTPRRWPNRTMSLQAGARGAGDGEMLDRGVHS
jgi:hypothetical protein